MTSDPSEYVRNTIRSVPDWPHPGVMFRDITPVLQDPRAFRVLLDLFVYRYMRLRLDLVAGVDARGFILGAVRSYELTLRSEEARVGTECVSTCQHRCAQYPYTIKTQSTNTIRR